jgi:hypothetical protein
MTGPGATDRADPERRGRLSRSDWTDQDLLTKTEARERLVAEIGRTRARLEGVRASTGAPDRIDAEVTMLARRLNAMEALRDEYNDYLDEE